MGKQSETELCRSRASKQSETEKARSWGWVGHGSEEGTTLVQLLHGNVQIWLPLLGVRLGEGGHNASTTGQPAVRRPQPAKQLEASGFTSRLGSIPPSLSIPFPVQLLNVYHSTRASRERARETSWVRIRAHQWNARKEASHPSYSLVLLRKYVLQYWCHVMRRNEDLRPPDTAH
jgi:hypothetical protein